MCRGDTHATLPYRFSGWCGGQPASEEQALCQSHDVVKKMRRGKGLWLGDGEDGGGLSERSVRASDSLSRDWTSFGRSDRSVDAAQPVLLQAAIQCRTGDPELLCDFGEVPPALRQNRLDGGTLAQFEAGGEERCLCRWFGANRVSVAVQELGWHVLKAEPVASRQDQHALDHVAQLPHVPWPGMTAEQVQYRGIETWRRSGLFGRDGVEEMLGQQDRVVATLAQ